MAKAAKKNRRPKTASADPVSSKQCEESLKNFCEPGLAFTDEIDVRAQTITPLLKEIMDFCPRPRWD